MIKNDTLDVKFRSQTTQARHFLNAQYKPVIDRIKNNSYQKKFHICLWCPHATPAHALKIKELETNIRNMHAAVRVIASEENVETAIGKFNRICCEENFAEGATDVLVALITDPEFPFDQLGTISAHSYSKLYMFIDKAVDDKYEGQEKPYGNLLHRHHVPDRYDYLFSEDFTKDILYLLKSVRAVLYMKDIFREKQKQLKQRKSTFQLLHSYKKDITVFLNNGYLHLLSFIRFLGSSDSSMRPDQETLKTHLASIPENRLGEVIFDLEKKGYIRTETKKCRLTQAGEEFFSTMGIGNLPVLENTTKTFKHRWKAALESVISMNKELPAHSGKLLKITRSFYQDIIREPQFFTTIRYFIAGYLFDCMYAFETEFLKKKEIEEIFKIWRESVAGYSVAHRAKIREKTRFLTYMRKYLTIGNNPAHAAESKRFGALAFNLRLLRPNREVHVYINFSFAMKKFKDIISEYLKIAIVSGDFDLLLRRLPQYDKMLTIDAAHGDRTPFDIRDNFDFEPLIYQLDTFFNVPIEMAAAETRQSGITIVCKVIADPELEKKKAAEVGGMQKKLDGLFDSPAKVRNVKIDDNGNARLMHKENTADTPEVIREYASKRNQYVQTKRHLDLYKSIPQPSSKCSLLIRFTLLDPVGVLLDGIDTGRPLDFDEIRYLLLCLDMMDSQFDSKSPPDINTIIDEVFTSPNASNLLKPKTRELIDKMEEFQLSDVAQQNNQDAWNYLKSKMIAGKYKLLLQTICKCLQEEAFDLIFSLMPLLTGVELSFDRSGNIVQSGKKTDTPADNNDSKTRLPLTNILQREIIQLLENIFSKFLFVSAATARRNMEPILSKMVIEYCLNVKSNEGKFRQNLLCHLMEHYAIHKDFVYKYIIESESPDNAGKNFTKMTYGADMKRSDIKNNVEGIIEEINRTRKRLFKPGESNRLLCFIDPDSVTISIGKFYYEGDVYDKQESFLNLVQDEKVDLARQRNESQNTIESEEIRKKEGARLIKIEDEKKSKKLESDKLRAEIEKKRAELGKDKYPVLKEENEAKIDLRISEAVLNEDWDSLLRLLVMKASMEEEDIETLDMMLNDSPTLLRLIKADGQKDKEMHQLRHMFIQSLGQSGREIDAASLATIFRDKGELKMLMETARYREFIEVLANMTRWGFSRNRMRIDMVPPGQEE